MMPTLRTIDSQGESASVLSARWRLFFLGPALIAFAPACGGGSSGSPPRDAAPESAATDDGSTDSGSCFPFCSSGDAGTGTGADAAGDAAMSCAQLKSVYEALQAPAQACNPQLTGQCSATTNGPCCPVTVTSSNQSAVNNFDQAVANYVTQCHPDCSMAICQPAPSNQCDPLGSTPAQGLCR
jgi:hypothetical protein